MRIRESAYMALVCLCFSVYHSLAQTSAPELHNGIGTIITPPATAGNWDIQFLSQPKLQLQGLQAGNKAIFSSFTACEIYDFRSGNWQTHQFSLPRRGIKTSVSGQNAFFAGGVRGAKHLPEFVGRVDVYNSENDRWYHSDLSQAREVGGAGSFGNIVILAGGIARNGYSSNADIFNTRHNKHFQHKLSDARADLAVGAAGNKIVFAGGLSGNKKCPVPSNAVDIYEVHSNTWTTARLSERRYDIAAASVGNKIIFAGGLTISANSAQPSGTIDIYDAVQNTWKKAELSEPKHGMSVAVADSKVYFAGGLLKGDILSDKLEIYDLKTDSWTVTSLPARRHGMAVGVTESRIMFAGGFLNDLYTTTSRVEVFEIDEGAWTVEHLSQPRANIAVASQGDKMIFAGGTDHSTTIATATTDIWHAATFVHNAAYIGSANLPHPVTRKRIQDWVYADPVNRDLVIADLWKYETQTVKISILNTLRQIVLTKSVIPFGDTKEQINVSNLQEGQYWVLVECNGRKPALTQVNIGTTDREVNVANNIVAMAPCPMPSRITSQY